MLMNDILKTQLAFDYCCTPEDVSDDKNIFTVYSPHADRRKFNEAEDCFLKITAINGKLLFTGRDDIIDLCRKKYENADGAWFMEPRNIIELDGIIRKFGFKIAELHPFYISEKITQPACNFETVYYGQREIEQFRGDYRFKEAFAFSPDAPDVIGIAAVKNGIIMGMAGASADSPLMYQIGINVLPEYSGKGIGTALVTLLKNKVLELGKLPFYGTAISHIVSRKTAFNAGFFPAWTELSTKGADK